jgi:hypothetical protein
MNGQVQVFGPGAIGHCDFVATVGGEKFTARHPTDEELKFHFRRPDPVLLASRLCGQELSPEAAGIICSMFTSIESTVLRMEPEIQVQLLYAGGRRTARHVLQAPTIARLREIFAAFSFPGEPAAFETLLGHYQRLLVRVEGYSSTVPANHKLEVLRACAYEVVNVMEKKISGVETI